MKETNATISLFLEAGRLIRSRMDRSMPLPFAQCELLRLVSEKDSPTMRDIARYFKIAAPSATSLVDELVRAGQLQRVRDAHDRRQVRVALTRKGREALKEVTARRKKVLAGIIAPLSIKDRGDFDRILSKILASA